MLELGAGFHPEYSGRDNIALSAALYGLDAAEVLRRPISSEPESLDPQKTTSADPIAIDRDNEIVAIFDEGRSFSPHEVASYLMRYFHSCYPAISFPC